MSVKLRAYSTMQFARYLMATIVSLLCGCSVISHDGIQSVAIGPDEQSIVFSYTDGSDSLIGVKNIDTVTCRVLLRSGGPVRYERPAFSPDASQLVFIARERDDSGDLYRARPDGSGPVGITRGQEGAENVQDFTFSADGESIVYINSSFFGHYSPIAASRPRAMDFYSISIDGTGLTRLSQLRLDTLNGLSLAPSGNLIYSIPLVFDTGEPRNSKHFNVHPSLVMTTRYPLSKVTPDRKLVIASGKAERRRPGYSSGEAIPWSPDRAVYGYGLYLVDLETKKVREIIHLPSMLDSPAVLNSRQRVFFIRHDEVFGGRAQREVWSVDLDGTDLMKIEFCKAYLD